MATTDKFSFAAFANYGNSSYDAAKSFQDAFKTDAIKFYAKAGYPSKDEMGVFNDITPDVTNTVSEIPNFVAGFMKDEKRAFNIPAADDNTAPATISVIHVDEKTSEGVNSLGPNKGEKWTSTVAAHDEVKVKINRNKFKSK